MKTPISGFPVMREESTSTAPGTFFSFAVTFAVASSSFFRSGPRIVYWIFAVENAPPPNAATSWTLMRRLLSCFDVISLRVFSISSFCASLRFSGSTRRT